MHNDLHSPIFFLYLCTHFVDKCVKFIIFKFIRKVYEYRR